jgi:hypothetical protein
MNDTEIPERLMNYNPEGKRSAGMPNVRWTDANNDVRRQVLRDLRLEADSRIGWQGILGRGQGLA